ncbi:MAG: GDYXXLXY domain-containing protein [Pseudomonadota bacterium]
MRRRVLAFVLLLPILGLTAHIGWRVVEGAGATDWTIPITGIDPRDPLRGNYLIFRYAWTVEGDPATCDEDGCEICLVGPPPDGSRLRIVTGSDPACKYPVDWAASGLRLSFMAESDENGGQGPVFSGRFFLPEAEAADAAAALGSGQPVGARVRRTRNGRLLVRELGPENLTETAP